MQQEIEGFRRRLDPGRPARADFVSGLAQSHRRGLGTGADGTTDYQAGGTRHPNKRDESLAESAQANSLALASVV
jgi:hypothetical protein